MNRGQTKGLPNKQNVIRKTIHYRTGTKRHLLQS